MFHDLLIEPLRAPFMRRAVLEVMLLGVLGGVVGVHVMLRRLSFLTEVVQHTVFPGIAIAFAFGQSLLLGALVTGIGSVLLLGALGRRKRIDADAAMAVLFAVFLAVGVVVVSRRDGFQADLTGLLFGRILTVDNRQLIETLIITAACVVAIAVVHKELVLQAFDPAGAEAMGYPLTRLDLVLDVVVALAVVAGIRAMGTVLAVALIVTPAATARLVCRRIGPSMLVAAADRRDRRVDRAARRLARLRRPRRPPGAGGDGRGGPHRGVPRGRRDARASPGAVHGVRR